MSWRQLELFRNPVSKRLESGVVVHRLSPNFEEVGASRQRFAVLSGLSYEANQRTTCLHETLSQGKNKTFSSP